MAETTRLLAQPHSPQSRDKRRDYGLNEEEEKEGSPCLSVSGSSEKSGDMWGVRRRVTLDLLMVAWGWGTWLGVNGVYMQLPLLVERLPEGWALPTSMVLAIQLANSGVLMYGLAKRLVPRVPDGFYIGLLLAVGTLALALNAFLYERTAPLAGTDRSVAFLALTFFTGLVGCTSSVLFYPHLRHYRDVYLSTYLVGEGLSGFLPSVLALVQGVGGEPECRPAADGSGLVPHYPPPRFGTTGFMLVLAALSAASLLSFVTLSRHAGFRAERVAPQAADKREEAAPRESLLRPRWLAVFALMTAVNALSNGVLPSAQSYSCMPYGARAYHLAVSLGAMANPAACLAGVWLRPLGARWLGGLLAVTLAPLAYILATAALSPAPPLAGGAAGEALVVCAWVWVAAALAYTRMWVYAWARRGGAAGMRACGAVTQLGSAAGSLLMFALVDVARLFTQADACPIGRL